VSHAASSAGILDAATAGGAPGTPPGDLPSADRLGSLLHQVADRAPEIDIDAQEDWIEDSLQITDVQPGRIWFEGAIGTIAIPRKPDSAACRFARCLILPRLNEPSATSGFLAGDRGFEGRSGGELRCLGRLDLQRSAARGVAALTRAAVGD